MTIPPARQAFVNETPEPARINNQGGPYTLVPGDSGRILNSTSEIDVNWIVPNGLGSSFDCVIMQSDAGVVTLIAGGSATLSSGDNAFQTKGPNSIEHLFARNSDDLVWSAAATTAAKVVQDITTSSTPLDLTEPFADVYIITSGGTKGIETINLPAFGSYADGQVGKEILFHFGIVSNIMDIPTISYIGDAADSVGNLALGRISNVNSSSSVLLKSDGLSWYPVGYGQNFNNSGGLPVASGFLAHVEGVGNIASNKAAHAEGLSTSATGLAAHAEGSGTLASDSYSHAEGNSSTASAPFSHAEGTTTVASGSAAHAEGQSTTASGNYSHAEGRETVADGNASSATGWASTTRGITSARAHGTNPITLGANQTIHLCQFGNTSDATPTVLTSDNGLSSSQNQLALVDNETLYAEVKVIGKSAGAADVFFAKYEVVIQRGTGAASTAIPTTTPTSPALISTYATAGAVSGSWGAALSADTTHGALAVTVTGQAATNITWTAEIRSLEGVL